MSKDAKRPPGGSGSAGSPPHKKGRREDEETLMEVDDSEEEVSSTSQQPPSSATPSSSTTTDPTLSVQPSSGNVSEGSGSVVGALADVPAATAAVPTSDANVAQSGGADSSAAVKKERVTLVAKRGRSPAKTQSEYKTYSDSGVSKDVAIKPLSPKPASLLPSDSSINFDERVVDVPPSPPAPSQQQQQPDEGDQASASVPPNIQPAVPTSACGMQDQQSAQIMIKYPDGRTEVIDVLNADHVRRVAKAGQVLRPIQSGLSASHPQTSCPHPVSTSSLPAALASTSSVPAPLAPGQADDDDDSAAVTQPQPDNTPKPDDSDSSGKQPQSGKGGSSKKSGKKKTTQEKYQSHSSPAISHFPPETQPQDTHLLSTPILSMTDKLKKKVVTTLELLDMKAELDRIARNLRSIQEESNLSDEDKKGDKDSDLNDDQKKGGKE